MGDFAYIVIRSVVNLTLEMYLGYKSGLCLFSVVYACSFLDFENDCKQYFRLFSHKCYLNNETKHHAIKAENFDFQDENFISVS